MSTHRQDPDRDNYVGGICLVIMGLGFCWFSVWVCSFSTVLGLLMLVWGIVLIAVGTKFLGSISLK